MTAVHDTLRQAIANAIHTGKCGSIRCQHRLNAHDFATADAVLADPEVRRRFAIAHAVDKEPNYARPLTDPKSFDAGHDMLLAKFRAAGKTT